MDTRTAKPTASVETPAAEVETVYCILHGWVKVGHGPCGAGHELTIQTEEGPEPEYCCFEGGYAYVAPPEMSPHIVDEMNDSGDWASQDDPDDWCADEVGAWEG